MSSQHTDPQPNIERARALLSPYIDGEVSAEEQQFVETQLATSNDLRQELESLRQTVSMLAQLPQLTAPRPFTLSEADVGMSPKASQSIFGLSNWFMGWAAAAASLVAVIVVAGTLFFNGQALSTQDVASVPAAVVAPAVEKPVEAEAEPAAEPEEAMAEEEASEAELFEAAEEAPQRDEAAVGAMARATPTDEPPLVEITGDGAGDSLPDMAMTESRSTAEEAAKLELFEEGIEQEAVEGLPQTADRSAAAVMADAEATEEESQSDPTTLSKEFAYQAEAATPVDGTTTMRATAVEADSSVVLDTADADDLPQEANLAENEPEPALEDVVSIESAAIDQPTVTPFPTPTDQPTVTPSPTGGASSEDVAPESGGNTIAWGIAGAILLLLLVGWLLWGRSRRG